MSWEYPLCVELPAFSLQDLARADPTLQAKSVAKRYAVTRRIGSGSFGQVYRGALDLNDVPQTARQTHGCPFIAVDLGTREAVAIKAEANSGKVSMLEHELNVYSMIHGGVGIPHIILFEREPGYSALVMEMLGPSLEDLLECCNRAFSLKTVLQLAEQLVRFFFSGS